MPRRDRNTGEGFDRNIAGGISLFVSSICAFGFAVEFSKFPEEHNLVIFGFAYFLFGISGELALRKFRTEQLGVGYALSRALIGATLLAGITYGVVQYLK